MSVLSTQYALRENVAQSLVPTGSGSRSTPSLPRIMPIVYQNQPQWNGESWNRRSIAIYRAAGSCTCGQANSARSSASV